MIYEAPGQSGGKVQFLRRYGNYIGGEFVPPVQGRYFENISPVTGKPFCEIPRSDEADIDKALDAAHAAKGSWGKTAPSARADVLDAIANRLAGNTEMLAVAEAWDNRISRGIQAGRVWVNCYHLYPAHAAFGGYKQSGFGRENHKMMLDHYQQTKSMLVSYDPKPTGLF